MSKLDKALLFELIILPDDVRGEIPFKTARIFGVNDTVKKLLIKRLRSKKYLLRNQSKY